MMDPGAMPSASDAPVERKEDQQTFEVFLDHLKNQATGGVDSVQLVSSDGIYDQTLPLSAAAPKGGLLSLEFKKVLPNKIYAMYWLVAGAQITFCGHVPFSLLLAHAPGTERDPM